MTEPVISGFHPDPTICRAGDSYYIATSSFEYSPGIPIHRSNDLVTWELVGNALDRPSQLRPSPGTPSSGIYAPTLRHHKGRFWLATTDTSRPFDGQLIVNADHAEGPWSDPVFVPGAVGIDPDLTWDDEGTAHLSWKSFHPDLLGIASAPIDLASGELLSDPLILWEGTGLPHIEAPHLYKVGKWWYLLVAEGGTERGHVASVARSRSLRGPYEGAPGNPILTHRSTSSSVQNTGHGDLIQTVTGEWAMVYLGVRPRGIGHGFHVNGRETFIAGIDWRDGWPVVREDRFQVPARDHSFTDGFSDASLHPRWVAPGTSPTAFSTPCPQGLNLVATPGLESRPILLTRALDPSWSAEFRLDVSRGSARVILRIDDEHWYALTIDEKHIEVTLCAGPIISAPVRMPSSTHAPLTVKMSVHQRPAPEWGAHPEPDLIGFALVNADGTELPLGEFDGRYLSTEVAGGFTGRMWGVEILHGNVIVESVSYTTG
ncbi:family 43 glycosylhydrolase [Microbacterium sp. NPDC089698]|uniref:glycoside hydrolase family 43 protein n=1 Tax=Microbacterium sp. NPDC089698 TaxID=3364200 RepID=UPI0037FE859B